MQWHDAIASIGMVWCGVVWFGKQSSIIIGDDDDDAVVYVVCCMA